MLHDTWPRTVFTLGLLALAGSVPTSAQVLVDLGTSMRYRANLTDPQLPALAWTQTAYDESGWSLGLYGVGYETGNGAQSLLTSYVPENSRSVFTRTTFLIDDPATVQSLRLGVDYDDGVVAWINGVEVFRSPEMPLGDPAWNTVSSGHESSNGVDPTYEPVADISAFAIPVLQQGANVLAIGVWNDAFPSSDLVLVPRLYANSPSTFVTRGPYLQRGSPSSVVIRWSTASNSKTRVSYGLSPDQLDASVSKQGNSKTHEVTLNGLSPDTIYYYAVGTNSEVLQGGDEEHYFRTAPLAGTRRPIRAWVSGDTGESNDHISAVRDAYVAFTAEVHTDVWIMLGDNAYDSGTQDEHESAVFNTFPRMLRRTPVWPTLGNHDAESASGAAQSGVYFDVFSLPAAAEAGGLSSGTEAYYSYDFGNVHFVVLDSEDVDRSPTGAMLGWLEADLMSHDQDWTVAYWHHPPYSKGSHDSDNLDGDDFELEEMRQWAVPLLEDWGVDLVLAGHSHSYERSFLLDGHHGPSTTLTPGMKLDAGDGRITGDGAYEKGSPGAAANEGAVYVVAGNASILNSPLGAHPAMFIGLLEYGSLALDIDGDRLDATFINDAGLPLDTFTIVKNTDVPPLADFVGFPLIGAAPLDVDFTDLSSSNTSAWTWDLDGDGSDDSTLRHPSASYGAGSYEVRLTASNASGSDQALKVGYVCSSEIPGVVMQLLLSDTNSLVWTVVDGATSYDVIKGNLAPLVASGGDFAASTPACLIDGAATEAFDFDAPPPGGTYYLVRAVSCADETGTYDSGGAGQVSPRDAASPTCP